MKIGARFGNALSSIGRHAGSVASGHGFGVTVADVLSLSMPAEVGLPAGIAMGSAIGPKG
jgi:hypothetical protein